MYSSILFPVDLEHDASWKKALPIVAKLAATFGAKIHVLTVVPEVRSIPGAEHFPTGFEEKIVAEAKQRVAAFLQNHQVELPMVTGHVEIGRPYQVIVKTADQLDCDLIVMGSHRPEIIDFFIGPNADHVVRHTSKSVLVVRN